MIEKLTKFSKRAKNKEYYLNLDYSMMIKKMPNNERYKGEYKAFYKEYPKIIEVENKKVRMNVLLPQSVLEAIDKIANNRSKFLTKSVKTALAMT